jgi:fatty-acyl-CoA synthase
MSVDYLALQARLQPRGLSARDLTSGQAWNFRQFDEDAWRMAAVLRAQGVGAGDRVALLAKNRISVVLLHLACARLEANFVSLN